MNNVRGDIIHGGTLFAPTTGQIIVILLPSMCVLLLFSACPLGQSDIITVALKVAPRERSLANVLSPVALRERPLANVLYGGPGGRATRRCLCDDDDATIDDGDATIDDGDATIDDDDATIDDDDATIDDDDDDATIDDDDATIYDGDANAHSARGTGQYAPPGARRHAGRHAPNRTPHVHLYTFKWST